MNAKILSLCLATSLVVGCASPLSIGALPDGASIDLRAHVQGRGYATMAAGFTSVNIHHLVLKLFTVTDAGETPVIDGANQPVRKDIPQADLDKPVRFARLKSNTTYRVRAYAYQAAGTDEADLISATDSGSYVDIVVTDSDRPTVADIPVKLKDGGVFAGTATSSVMIVGTYTPSGSISVSARYLVSTFAGQLGQEGSSDGAPLEARFTEPSGMCGDKAGNLYVADAALHVIRKITPQGVVSTFAGGVGVSGTADGTGTAARFKSPYGLAMDAQNNLYVADTFNHAIRKITPAGVVSTVAGTIGVSGSSNGSGTAASFKFPYGVAVASDGTLYVADTQNHVIRKIASNLAVTTYAGHMGTSGSRDGSPTTTAPGYEDQECRFNEPRGLLVDPSGGLLIVDSGNFTIRHCASNFVNTFVGSAGQSGTTDSSPSDVGGISARLMAPTGIVASPIDQGGYYLTDGNRVRHIGGQGQTMTIAGTEDGGSADGPGAKQLPSFFGGSSLVIDPANAASFQAPDGIAVGLNGAIFVADTYNFAIRKVQ